jgi:hypothetical protein
MSHRSLGIFIAVALVLLPLYGCGSSRKNRPQAELDQMKKEIVESAKQADFYFEQSYYSAAKKIYEKMLPKAEEYVYYGGDASAVDDITKRAKTRLESREMAEGSSGKVFLGDAWVNPQEYALSKSRELVSRAAGNLQADTDTAKTALKELSPAEDQVLEQDPAKRIVALGKDATPFVVLWTTEADADVNALALSLLMGMEETEDIIFATALANAQSKIPQIAERGALLLSRFPRKETAVMLITILDRRDDALVDRAVEALCSTNTELGRQYIFETAKTARKLSLLRASIIKHISVFNSKDAVEVLVSAANEGFSDPTMAMIKQYAIDSLLKTNIPETLLALTAILRKAGPPDKPQVLQILQRIEDSSYHPAAPAVAEVFATFSGDKEVMDLAVEVMKKIADQSSVDSVVSMVLALDVKEGDNAAGLETDDLFARITNILKTVKSADTIQRFINMLSEYQTKETNINAAHALGAFGEEADAAVPKLISTYQRPQSDDSVRKAVINALARIGSQAAMDYLAIIIRGSKSEDVSQYLTTMVPKIIVRESAFKDLFAKMDGTEPAVLETFFKTIADCKNPAALPGLLATAQEGEESVRLEALRTLAAFKDQIKEADTLDNIFKSNIARLQSEPDVLKAKRLFEAIKPYGEATMPALMVAVRINTWAIRYYAADAIAQITLDRPAVMSKYRDEMREYSKKLESFKDYHSALKLARASGLPTKNLEDQIKSLAQDVNTLDPSKVMLGGSLKDMTDKLGSDYKELASRLDPAVTYCYYPSLGLVFAFRKARIGAEQQIWGIGYVKGFKEHVFGALIGEKIDEAFMAIGPPPEDMRYYETHNVYSWFNSDRHRSISFILEPNQAVRCAAETAQDADPGLLQELRNVMEAATVTSETPP